MNRLALLAIVVLCPAAHAQDDYGEGRKLAATFSQADLDKLGECQARLEGAALVHAEFSEWLRVGGHQPQLEAITKAKDASVALIDDFSTVRQQAANAPGMTIASSDAARTATLETFKRLPSEDNFTAYSRIQPQSKLGSACSDALKRGRWKIEIDGLGNE